MKENSNRNLPDTELGITNIEVDRGNYDLGLEQMPLGDIAKNVVNKVDDLASSVAERASKHRSSIVEAVKGGNGDMNSANEAIGELRLINDTIREEARGVKTKINELLSSGGVDLHENSNGDGTQDRSSEVAEQPDKTETEENAESLAESMLIGLEKIVVHNLKEMTASLKDGDLQYLMQLLNRSNTEHMLSRLAIEFLKSNQPTEAGQTEGLNPIFLLRNIRKGIEADFWDKFEADIPEQENASFFKQLNSIISTKSRSLVPWSHESNVNSLLGEILNAKRIALWRKKENPDSVQNRSEPGGVPEDSSPQEDVESFEPTTEPWAALDASWEGYRFRDMGQAESYAEFLGQPREEWLLRNLNKVSKEKLTLENLGKTKVSVVEDGYINQIAGMRIRRTVLLCSTGKEASDLKSRILGGDARHPIEGSHILFKEEPYSNNPTMAKEGIILSSDESYILRHEMLHSVDPNINHRSKENAILTEMFGYWAQAKLAIEEGLISQDQIWGESYASLYGRQEYYDQFKPDLSYEEYLGLASQVAKKAREIYESAGEISMMRAIGESRTIQEFLER